jgi:hypothetical protein
MLPVRSTAVLQRRIADALAILADALDPATPVRRSDDFVAAIAAVEQIAPAFRTSRLIMRRVRALQPAEILPALQELHRSLSDDPGDKPPAAS